MSEIRWLPLESNPEARQIYSRSLAAVSLKHDDKDCSVQTCNADGTGQATAGITESSTDPPTHRPYHRPTWSVMRSVSDGRWVDVVEGALQRLAAGG